MRRYEDEDSPEATEYYGKKILAWHRKNLQTNSNNPEFIFNLITNQIGYSNNARKYVGVQEYVLGGCNPGDFTADHVIGYVLPSEKSIINSIKNGHPELIFIADDEGNNCFWIEITDKILIATAKSLIESDTQTIINIFDNYGWDFDLDTLSKFFSKNSNMSKELQDACDDVMKWMADYIDD